MAIQPKQQKLHMIGNAHIDPVWLWQWPEGFHEVKATFRSALDRMKEYDDFLFVSSSAAFYEWVEKSDPAMFAEIQKRVAEARWEIVGGWWIQPDCNIPGGESFARQGLYGQRYFKEKFGVMAKVGYNVDSFGHHGMLPQILCQSGMDSYVFMRPSPHEKALPGRLFWWEADDGSRVLTFRIPFEYCTSGKELDLHIRRVANELRTPFDQLMCFYGVGNHGGGPTKANIESIKRLNQEPDLPALVFSTPNAFFKEILSQSLPIPVYHGDLQHHASGCYAAHSGVKRWNRQAENALIAAEKFSTLAARLVNQPYPDRFGEAWKDVLFNQFHDIMAGTSLESAYEDARNQYGEALAIASRALNYATQALAWQINIPPEDGMKPVIVFNPHAWQSRISVEIESGRIPDGHVLLDDHDQRIPFQLTQSEATSRGRFRLNFVADLPPMGYRTYRLAARPADELIELESSHHVLENRRFRLEFDTTTGAIKQLYDKTGQLDVFAGPAAMPLVIDDPSDTWSHGVYAFNKVIGPFALKSLRRIEHGPVKSTIRVVSSYGASTLIQDFSLFYELNTIEVRVTVDWREHFKMLKLRFPVNVHFMKVTREIPYGSIECFANGEELPMQSWVDVSGSSRDTDELYGVSILNDGKSSCDVNVKDIGLTVLRSPIYAHHEPMIPDSKREYTFIDQGIQRFTYAILPHAGGWEQAGTVRRAAELSQRPIALFGTYHAGPLPQSAGYVSAEPENLIVSVLKKAEDNDDLIVRCFESAHRATHGTIRVLDQQIEADFGPSAIKTFRIPKSGPIRETNLLEL
ncbi:MAG: alpha-mannosidase [Aggregatilineales bacterium]